MTGLTTDIPPLASDMLRRVAARDRAAFAELYDRTSAKLFGVALRILQRRDLAEDVLQESFVAIWEHAGEYDPVRGSVMTWLMTIVRHRAIDQRRRCAHLPDAKSEPEEVLLGLAAGPSDRADRGADLGALQHCLDGLEEQPRRAVLLAYAYGYTHEELAVRLTVPVGTVKSWVRRSLERLKRCLDG